MSKSKIIIFSILNFAFMYLNAAWFDYLPWQLTQPDGTDINVFLSGDEFYHWAHDSDGFTITQDPKSGYWCWATHSQAGIKQVVSSGFPIHLYTPQSIGLQPNIKISEDAYREKRAGFQYVNNPHSNRNTAPTTGVVNNIVIFIRFANQYEFTETMAFYEDIFNNDEYEANSLYRYFYDASYGQLQVFSTFYPQSEGLIVTSYRSGFSRNYFLPYDPVFNPVGYTGGDNGQERTLREHTLLADAIHSVADQIPLDLDIDSDNDGIVDNVIFMIRGFSGSWSSLLWPHKWQLHSHEVYIHGKRVWQYNLNMEDYFYDPVNGGTALLVHEFGHSLGAPDFYRYHNTSINPTGIWEVMSVQTNPPQSMSAYVKQEYMGWVDSLPEITENGIYTLYPISTNRDNHAYKIASPYSDTEYFVVEYRNTRVSLTDSTLPGSGLLVYRINTKVNGNAQGPPDEVYVYRPNGTLTTNGSISSAFFNSAVGRTKMDDTTNPRSFLSSGSNSIGGLKIFDIGAADFTITFSVTVTDESSSDDLVVQKPKIELFSNYPNPFNPNTTIHFGIQNSQLSITSAQNVVINIYNVKGQKVRSLINGYYEAGKHSAVWDGKDDQGNNMCSGIYLYRMISSGFSVTKKMVLMK